MSSTPSPPSTLALRTITKGPETHIDVLHIVDSGAVELGSIPAREPNPTLPVTPGSINHLVALDVLEAVLDEEAWISALGAALEPGGTALVRVPLEGPTAWLDALNLYRYAQDISGLGPQLQETRLKGWHRHYRPAELRALADRLGFDMVGERREGNPLLELAQLGALAWGGMVRGTTEVEERVRSWREDREDFHRLERLGPLSTRITITLRKRP